MNEDNTFMNRFHFNYDPSKPHEVYAYGDFLKKSSLLLQDSDEKWKIVCGLADVQSTEFPTSKEYARRVELVAKDLELFLSERPNWNPFSL